MTIKAYIFAIFLCEALLSAHGLCSSSEAVSLLRLEKVVGEWDGTHILGDKTDCSRVQITKRNEEDWHLRRTSTLFGNIADFTFRQADKASGRLEATDANNNKLNVTVLLADYNRHLLIQECTPDGNVTTSFLQRRAAKNKFDGDTELITALYDLKIPPNSLQFCHWNDTCEKWPTVVSSLDEQRISGGWREAGRIRVPGSIQRRRCLYLTLTPTDDGKGLSLIYSYEGDGKRVCLEGTAKYEYPSTKRGVLTLSGRDMSSGEVWILDTNYESYALVSLCTPAAQSYGNEDGIIVLTRSGTLSSADAFAINAALISAGKSNNIETINPGFDRLDSSLDLAPLSCETEQMTCGAKFKYLSPLLLFGLISRVLLQQSCTNGV